MDIWYLPTITEYIKLLVKPILYKLSPEEATKVLEDFDPKVRKFFLTKGIINLVPSSVQNMLMPADVVETRNNNNKLTEFRENQINIQKNLYLLHDENISGSTGTELHINNINNAEEKSDHIQIYKPKKFKKNSSPRHSSNVSLLEYDNNNNNNQSFLKNPHLNLSHINHNLLLEEKLHFPLNFEDF